MGSTLFCYLFLRARSIPVSLAWLGVVCYSLQIYFDFSGYSDMAVGLGRMFGLEFPRNFRHPYSSRSITEFLTAATFASIFASSSFTARAIAVGLKNFLS